jgi:hypothetical protein
MAVRLAICEDGRRLIAQLLTEKACFLGRALGQASGGPSISIELGFAVFARYRVC